jgi:hypothetical protein
LMRLPVTVDIAAIHDSIDHALDHHLDHKPSMLQDVLTGERPRSARSTELWSPKRLGSVSRRL